MSGNSVENIFIESRQCWICFEEELFESVAYNDNQRANSHWLSPCRCRGSIKWVHNQCLQQLIDERQKQTGSDTVFCTQCDTQYIVVYPPNSLLVQWFQRYESYLNNASPKTTLLFIGFGLYLSASSYGAITCCQIIGHKKVEELSKNLFFLYVGLPSIPFVLIAGKLFLWENLVLRLWALHHEKIPFLTRPSERAIREIMRKSVFGLEDSEVQVQPNQIRVNISKFAAFRAFCGALLLPTVGKSVGECLYNSIESDLNKTLLGGLTFILIKGCLKIYCRQQQYVRQSKRKILNYSESIEFANPGDNH